MQKTRKSKDYRAAENQLRVEKRSRKSKQFNAEPIDCKTSCLEGNQSTSQGVLQSVGSNQENLSDNSEFNKPENVMAITLDFPPPKKKTNKKNIAQLN